MLRLRSTLLLIPLMALAPCRPDAPSADSAEADASAAAPDAPLEHTLVALPGKEAEAPVLTTKQTILMQTDAGDLTIEVYPEAAPNAVARFVELVENGFYNDTPISRVVPGFVAQFGVNWRESYRPWQFNTFADDPTLFSLDRGTLAFAKAGPNSNSTQVFINYVENNRLAEPQYNFTVFGKVIEGMDVVDAFVEVGDPGMGLDQARLWADGGNYLESLTTKPTMIRSTRVIE